MDVVNDLHMGPPAITNLGGSLTSADEVNSSKKWKSERKNTEGKAVECEGPNFSLDNSSPNADASIKQSLHESPALPTLLSCKTVELNSRKENGMSKRLKTEHNATQTVLNGCNTAENTCSSTTANMALDKNDTVMHTSLVKTNDDDPAVYDLSDKNQHVKTYIRRKKNSDYPSPENCNKEPTMQDYDKDDLQKNSVGSLRDDSETKFSSDQVTLQSEAEGQETKLRPENTIEQRKKNSDYPSPENCNKEPTMQDYDKDDSQKNSVGSVRDDSETKFSSDQVTLQSEAEGQETKLRPENTIEQRFMTSPSVEQHETNGRQLYHSEFTRNDQCCAGDVSDLNLVTVKDGHSKISQFSLDRNDAINSKNKLLILDVNGLLADFVGESDTYRRYKPEPEPDIWIRGKRVYKRPFCDDFLQFCFDRFHVGVWSSRAKSNADKAIEFLLGKSSSKLLFCWNQSHCTMTEFTTVENREKPLVLKEVRKLWEKVEPDLPWEKGEFNESNTLLLDDSPYKALMNPEHTAIFPYSYRYYDTKDSSLGPGGDLRVYLDGLAMADNVQDYVAANPFGQRPIRKANPSWRYYCKVIESVKRSQRSSSPDKGQTAYRRMHDERC